MSDVKYEYGCEITSTSECPLREEIRAEVIDEIKSKANCEETECWDCAFGDAEVGCLLREQK